MKKIPSVFQRNYDGDRLVRDEVVPGCEWVLAGEGQPTVKWDGTACAVIGGFLYKRYDVKKGRAVPPGAIPCEVAADENTGHWPHWVPVTEDASDRWALDAWNNGDAAADHGDGTYELIGPKVQGNPYGMTEHVLMPHGEDVLAMRDPRTFDDIRTALAELRMEGIVWHHPDGRMAKAKRKDFGLPWPQKP